MEKLILPISDLSMFAVSLLIALYFYCSKGRAADYLAGYNMKSEKPGKSCDEAVLCRVYGKRLIYMALPFLPGAVLDWYRPGMGSALAWIVWLILFAGLLLERRKREQ